MISSVPMFGNGTSSEFDIFFKMSEVRASTPFNLYAISLKCDPEKLITEISITCEGKAIDIKVKDLAELVKPELRWMEIVANGKVDIMKMDGIILEIPYNRTRIRGKNERKIIQTLDVARLHFLKDRFVALETCKAVPGEPGKWKLNFHDLVKGETYDTGEGDSANNPFLSLDFSSGKF